MWTHQGGSKPNSTQNTSGMKRAPRKKMTNTAGPSPASCFLRSRPQALQRSAIFRMPENSRPLPQRGQRQAGPARIALGGAGGRQAAGGAVIARSEEHKVELQSLMRNP